MRRLRTSSTTCGFIRRHLGLLDLDQNLCRGQRRHRDHGEGHRHGSCHIPYTNRPLGWHTDGYYNAGEHQVRAWLLYCAQPAAEGGDNELLDHEIAYIRIRDQNPEWIRALMAADALPSPATPRAANRSAPDHGGPVFRCPADGSLHMRYSARQRNVIWKDDAARAAAVFLLDMFRRGDDHILRYRLQAGEGS